MSVSVLYMSMSLDGYIAGPNDELGHPFGDEGDRLHDWFVTPEGEFFRPSTVFRSSCSVTARPVPRSPTFRW